MDCSKVGNIIFSIRKEKNMTQKQLADIMNISDKTISKWERGLGCPDVSLLSELSDILGINIKELLSGDLSPNSFVGGNMKNTKFYVCPICGNVSVCTGDAEINCCKRKLKELEPVKATEKLIITQTEGDWYITCDHPMTKDNYISFIAFATGDKLQIIKQYPEWDMNARIPKREHGKLLWYNTAEKKLYYQLI